MIVFNGQTSDAYRVVVQHYPRQTYAERDVTKQYVAGRNGSLTIDNGGYKNCTQEYEVYLKAGERKRMPAAASRVAQWLLSPPGYCRLEDTYNPGVYRMARFSGPLDVENLLNRFGTATLTFDCKPQRFLKSGEQPIRLTAPAALCNSGMEALPLITVSGSGPGTLTVGGVTVTLHALDGQLCLDCDTQNAYRGMENKNSTIYAPEFPRLLPGRNEISWTGGVERLEIIPRWWTL